MKKKRILINAVHPEERRVAIVEGDLLVDFYVEVSARESLKGNVYKGEVSRIEPGLQAAFVDFGPKKRGFLQFGDIKPELYEGKQKGKWAKIQDVIKKGQELLVQVERDERDTKGASLTTYVSLAGRYVVMMPGEERVGVSRKIEEKKDRVRLKEIFHSLKLPKDMGFILRTAGSDKTEEDFEDDLAYLTKLWKRIQADAKKVKAPALVYQEHDIAVRTVRDYLTSDVSEVIVDEKEAFKSVKAFLKQTMPGRKVNLVMYKDKMPLFERFGIGEQIARLNDRHVRLPSRGYLVFDKTEALTAIDVNSGRGRKDGGMEATAYTTNMEAVEEIARQLRLRDIGGLIVLDLIDMMDHKHRQAVEDRLKDALDSDKAHWDITKISRFGMIEMTRERLRTAFLESAGLPCSTCGGTGTVRSDEMTAVAAFRDLHLHAARGGTAALTCRLPVAAANYLINTRRTEVVTLEKDFSILISIVADPALPAGQFSIEGIKEQRGGGVEARGTREEASEAREEAREEARPVRCMQASEEPALAEDFEEDGAAAAAGRPEAGREEAPASGAPRKRRGRRGGRGRRRPKPSEPAAELAEGVREEAEATAEHEGEPYEPAESAEPVAGEASEAKPAARKRRGRRGGRGRKRPKPSEPAGMIE